MTENAAAPASGSIMVVGGGISGLTAALEAAEVGYEVFLVEKNPYLGGRVAQLNQYFPKLCPPTCGLEINFRRIKDNPLIKVFTMSEVEKVEGTQRPSYRQSEITRYVNENCTCCGDCTAACETEIDSFFDFGMQKIKGAHLPFEMAFPARFVIHQSVKDSPADAQRVKESCKYDAVDFDMAPKTIDLQAGSIIWATGWEPYDAKKMTNLKFGENANIITNMMMERMASPNGPTKGEIKRPSDGKAPESVAFVQCAGSRDENHLPYCSYICCMASLKQATYVRATFACENLYFLHPHAGAWFALRKFLPEDQRRREYRFYQRQSGRYQ